MTVTVVMLRGNGEKLNNRGSLLWQLAAKVEALSEPDAFEWIDAPYNATIGPSGGGIDGASLQRNTVEAFPIIDKIVRDTDNLVMGLGYSQGAYTWSRYLERKPKDCIIPWAAFVANPLRCEGVSWDKQGAPGFGLAGQHGAWPLMRKVWEVANPGDGITCCPGNSPLRTVADVVDPLSFALGGGWTQGLIDKLLSRQFQIFDSPWAAFFDRGRYTLAAHQVAGYLNLNLPGIRPEHGAVYRTDGYLDRLAAEIAREVR